MEREPMEKELPITIELQHMISRFEEAQQLKKQEQILYERKQNSSIDNKK